MGVLKNCFLRGLNLSKINNFRNFFRRLFYKLISRRFLYYFNTAEVRHPINSDCKLNKKVTYCYACGTSVRQQQFCHGCGRRLIWNPEKSEKDFAKYLKE